MGNNLALLSTAVQGGIAAYEPMIEDEIEGIYNHWNAPMVGFFTYGEIGNTHSNPCQFHNETCSLIVLKER